MSRISVAYSRADRQVMNEFLPLLHTAPDKNRKITLNEIWAIMLAVVITGVIAYMVLRGNGNDQASPFTGFSGAMQSAAAAPIVLMNTPPSPPTTSCFVTSQSDVNLRSGPGTDYSILGILNAGRSVSVVAQATETDGYDWWQLDSGVWVRFDLVSATANCVSIPVVLSPLMQAAQTPVSSNDWLPVIRSIDRVEMVLVPAGCFEMGGEENSGARPAHEVCFEEPFWIDRTEVTNGQFAAFNGLTANPSYVSEHNHPREQITWIEAAAFCASRGARLPTEAEWEYAARGPENLEYPWGNEFDRTRAIWLQNSGQGTALVGSLPAGASWVGALDLSGNVWEWVADWYGTYPEGPQVNPTGPAWGSSRVLRGGSWSNSRANTLHAANRNFMDPRDENYYIGFRCARSVSNAVTATEPAAMPTPT